jgi:hypothetical protein
VGGSIALLKCCASSDIVTIPKEVFQTHVKKASMFAFHKKSDEITAF